MGFNYSRNVSYGRKLSDMGEEVERLNSNTRRLTDIIPSKYDGQDARIYQTVVEQLQSELKSIASELKNVGSRVINAAAQIEMEEE